MEALEETENEGEEFDKDGSAGEFNVSGGNTRRDYWFAIRTVSVNMVMKKRLVRVGF